MTPNDLEEYLLVLGRHNLGSAAVKLADGAEIHVVFIPQLPAGIPTDPKPGAWKGQLQHLDNPEDLRQDFTGELPS